MKKILTIISILIFSTSAYANNRLNGFNKWLYDNGHYELVEKIEKEICKSLDKGDPKYNTNLCHLDFYKNNLNIKFYNGWLPEQTEKPNFGTLLFELYKFTYSPYRDKPMVDVYEVKPS
jgi:hypothetical protein